MPICNSHPIPKIKYYCSLDRDVYKSLRLFQWSHKPQDILDAVKSLTKQPDYLQQLSKEEFVYFYRKWIGMETPKDVQQLQDLNRDLGTAMEALDVFFVAGSLTMPLRYGKHGKAVAYLKVQNNVFGVGQPGYQAYLRTGPPMPLGMTAMSDGSTTIFIDTLKNGSPTTVKSIFENLVHEMAHAIFDSFACGGADCMREANSPSIFGQRGHGDLWVELAEHMTNTIQTWDSDLADFYNTNDIRWHNENIN